jgi:hypothetical protein
LQAAAEGGRLKKRLSPAVARVTGAQVADALLDYYDLGISTFLSRGFDPWEDATQYEAVYLNTPDLCEARGSISCSHKSLLKF